MTTSDSPFTLRPDGVIVLPDDDGDPHHYLQPDEAFALATFIEQNRDAIETAASKARTIGAYNDVAVGIRSGLPTPQSTHTRWDGRLKLDLGTEDDFTAWAAWLGGTPMTDTHPELGSRRTLRGVRLHIEGPWDRVPSLVGDSAVSA